MIRTTTIMAGLTILILTAPTALAGPTQSATFHTEYAGAEQGFVSIFLDGALIATMPVIANHKATVDYQLMCTTPYAASAASSLLTSPTVSGTAAQVNGGTFAGTWNILGTQWIGEADIGVGFDTQASVTTADVPYSAHGDFAGTSIVTVLAALLKEGEITGDRVEQIIEAITLKSELTMTIEASGPHVVTSTGYVAGAPCPQT